MDFHERTDERDRLEGETDPPHREAAGKFCHQIWATVGHNALVEVDNGFSKPYASDPERGDTYGGSREPQTCRDWYFKDPPTRKPTKPLQAHIRWNNGLSSFFKNQGLKNLSPNLVRKANVLKKMKKSHEHARPKAMRWGVATAGSNIKGVSAGNP